MDFEPRFKVYNLVSVHPRSMKLGQVTNLNVIFHVLVSLYRLVTIGPLHYPVTWYGINYTGTQVTQWDFQNKGTRTSPARLFFVLKVVLRNLRPSVIYSMPCDRIVKFAPVPC